MLFNCSLSLKYIIQILKLIELDKTLKDCFLFSSDHCKYKYLHVCYVLLGGV